MSERLDYLYRAAHQLGAGFEPTAEAWRAFKDYAVSLAEGLPFTYRLVTARPSRYATSIGAVHIAVAEEITIGKLQRRAGDALCRHRWEFAGGLGGLNELRPAEEGATCRACLEIAERHSILEWRAS